MLPLPTAPLLAISIAHSSSSVMAGQPLTLTCSTSVQEGVNGSLSVTWTKDDLEQPGEVRSGSVSLHLTPLHTSHSGVYTCTARLIIPEVGVDVTESNMTTVTIQSMLYNLSFHNSKYDIDNIFTVLTPNVSVSVPPGPLFAGSTAPLTLTCSISLNPATDTSVSVTTMDITWLNGTTPLSNSDDRVVISSLSGSQPSFTSTLTLSPLSTFDNTNFTCRARARPLPQQNFITASEEGARTVSVTVNCEQFS